MNHLLTRRGRGRLLLLSFVFVVACGSADPRPQQPTAVASGTPACDALPLDSDHDVPPTYAARVAEAQRIVAVADREITMDGWPSDKNAWLTWMKTCAGDWVEWRTALLQRADQLFHQAFESGDSAAQKTDAALGTADAWTRFLVAYESVLNRAEPAAWRADAELHQTYADAMQRTKDDIFTKRLRPALASCVQVAASDAALVAKCAAAKTRAEAVRGVGAR